MGSEMCIRDSIYNDHIEQVKEQLSRDPRPYPQLELTKAESIFDYCLLYTSDAADDMQCVDLGGRRIIKKKKKKKKNKKKQKKKKKKNFFFFFSSRRRHTR